MGGFGDESLGFRAQCFGSRAPQFTVDGFGAYVWTSMASVGPKVQRAAVAPVDLDIRLQALKGLTCGHRWPAWPWP